MPGRIISAVRYCRRFLFTEIFTKIKLFSVFNLVSSGKSWRLKCVKSVSGSDNAQEPDELSQI